MPELPDITIYIEALERKLTGRPLQGVRLASPFVLRTVEPRPKELVGRTVKGFRRIGKRIVFDFGDDLFFVVHLMIAGRFHWKDSPGAKIPGKIGLAAFDFENGTLLFTEASTKKRASLHVVKGEEALADFSRGGLEPMDATLAQFQDALTCENHTLKRSLTDPTLFSGIGNAYSDEILHRAKLSPVKLTQKMTAAEIETLFRATRAILEEWTVRLRKELGDGFPEKVTAFRPEMAVHGRYKLPCPVCGSPVQRIVHAENESNYCATCQTGGKLLADRALSKLLHGDWPRSLEEMDEKKAEAKKQLGPAT
jgi:formamidopyrimidine-DNA glycosylase